MLHVVKRCRELVEKGVPAAAIEGIDFSGVTRAREACPPDGVAPVDEVYRTVNAQLGALG